MNRDTSIVAQALAKSIIEAVPRSEWAQARVDALRLYQDLLHAVADLDQRMDGGRPGGQAPAPTIQQPAADPGPPKRAQGPAAGATAPPAGGNRYTVKARSGKSTTANARLCLQDQGGTEEWVGFRGADARVAMQLDNGMDVTCTVERRGEWLNGSDLRRALAESDIPF